MVVGLMKSGNGIQHVNDMKRKIVFGSLWHFGLFFEPEYLVFYENVLERMPRARPVLHARNSTEKTIQIGMFKWFLKRIKMLCICTRCACVSLVPCCTIKH